MSLRLKDRIRTARRALLAPVNRLYDKYKRKVQSFIVKTVTLHAPASLRTDTAPASNELLLSLYRAVQRPAAVPPARMPAISVGPDRLLIPHPTVDFMYAGVHDLRELPWMLYGNQKERALAALEHHVAPGDVVIHVDARQGFCALASASIVGTTGHIVAVSRHEQDREILELNVETHGLRASVAVSSSLQCLAAMSLSPALLHLPSDYRATSDEIEHIERLLHAHPALRIVRGSDEIALSDLTLAPSEAPILRAA